jgi:predicted Zn-dependent protease
MLAAPPAAWAEPAPAGEKASLHWVELTLRQGDHERAVRGLARSLKREPTALLALRYAELALPLTAPASERERSRRQKAAELFLEVWQQPALQSGEWAHALSFHAAWAEALRDEYRSALALLTRVAGFDGARALPYVRALAALSLSKAPDVAEESLRLARTLAPAEPELMSELGLFWLAQGKAHDALPLLAARFALAPGVLSARRDYAYALSAAGRPGEAHALLDVVRAACRDADLCLLELARFALEARELGPALEHLATLRARLPRELAPLFLEADVQLARAEPGLAPAAYEQILSLAPDNLRAHTALQGLNAARAARP